mgnify:CR=1 FL=1
MTEAEAILTASLKIILEHIEYDAYFLNAILRCYPKWGRKIIEHKDKGWVEYTNGGGENIANVITELKTRFETQKNIFYLFWKLQHGWVMCY